MAVRGNFSLFFGEAARLESHGRKRHQSTAKLGARSAILEVIVRPKLRCLDGKMGTKQTQAPKKGGDIDFRARRGNDEEIFGDSSLMEEEKRRF